VGDGVKLLTYLNSALKVISGLDIFPLGTKKKLNFVDQCNLKIVFCKWVRLSEGRDENQPELHLQLQSVPRSKHSFSVIKISQLQLYREVIVACSKIQTKYINTRVGRS
jgi:hypothetical protein